MRITGIRIGLFTGAVMVIYALFVQWTQQHTHQAVTSLVYMIQGIGIYYAFSEFKRSNGGFMMYRQGIRIGLWLSLISGLIVGIYYYIDTKYNGNQMLQQMLVVQRQALEKNHTPSKQIEESMAIMKTVAKPPLLILAAIISNLFTGFLLSMVLSSFMQKKPVENEGQF